MKKLIATCVLGMALAGSVVTAVAQSAPTCCKPGAPCCAPGHQCPNCPK